MLAFPEMLTMPAAEAGMKVPDDSRCFSAKEFPHFFVYSRMQLGRSCPSPTSPWENAKIIAKLSNEDILKVTSTDLIRLGFV